MSTEPPPTLPTGAIPTGVTMPLRCVHGAHPDTCPFCKIDDELVANPELTEVKQRPHDFGCPLFDNEGWEEESVARANYQRIYGGDGRCNCKQPEKKEK